MGPARLPAARGRGRGGIKGAGHVASLPLPCLISPRLNCSCLCADCSRASLSALQAVAGAGRPCPAPPPPTPRPSTCLSPANWRQAGWATTRAGWQERGHSRPSLSHGLQALPAGEDRGCHLTTPGLAAEDGLIPPAASRAPATSLPHRHPPK